MADIKPGAPDWMLNGGLFVILLLLTLALADPVTAAAQDLVVLGFGLHVFLSVYDGRFGRLRTITWLLALGGWTASIAAEFAGYVLPWGQVSFWFAARLHRWFGIDMAAAGPIAVAFDTWRVFPILFGLDVLLLHGARVRRWPPSAMAAFAGALLVTLVALGSASRELPPPTAPRFEALATPVRILPSLTAAPFYAVLRAVPHKAAGVAAMFAAMVLPMVWPWARAWRFHARPCRALWACLWLALGGTWIGLLWLGLQPPSPAVIVCSQILAVADFIFFLAVPPILLRLLPRLGAGDAADAGGDILWPERLP